MEWDEQQPGRVMNVFKSMSRISCSHMLDQNLFDFKSLTTDSAEHISELDIAFDESPMETLMQRSDLNAESIETAVDKLELSVTKVIGK